MAKAMKIGVDSCVIIAGVHASHPMHAVAADWLIRNIAENRLVVAHHSILETYAVLTRLPGRLRTSAAEAQKLIEGTVRANMNVAPFQSDAIWNCLDALIRQTTMGGSAYDAFILHILTAIGIKAFATFNTAHFARIDPQLALIDPSNPVSGQAP